jgi:putative transposase
MWACWPPAADTAWKTGGLTGRGSQLTGEALTGRPVAAGVAISMDGRGRFPGIIFVERLMAYYNGERPYQAADNRMAMAKWRACMEKIEAPAQTVGNLLNPG